MTAAPAWRRRGLLFAADGQRPWMRSHASVPFAERVEGSLYRVYFSTRDAQGRSHVAAAVVDIERPGDVLDLSEHPLLGPGELGTFDDSGAMLSWICADPSSTRRLWYYIGWNLGVTVPFRNAIGLAYEQDGRVERAFPGPILDRTRDEPHFTASCCVLDEGDLWRMYYLACTGWEPDAGGVRHRYHLRYAESANGVDWARDGRVAIDFADASEYAISRPSVLRADDGYSMWFSARGERYRIFHALSEDGIAWTRTGHSGLDASGTGWESTMVCYPHVLVHDDRQLLFYNGDRYGGTGFGFADRPLP